MDKTEVLSTILRERKIWLEIVRSLEETEREINAFLWTYYPKDVEILKSFGFSEATIAYSARPSPLPPHQPES